jgi:hypothetical protein
MFNNQLKNIKKNLWLGEKTHLKKKDLNRVLPGRPGHESTRFCRVFAYPDPLSYLDQSSH